MTPSPDEARPRKVASYRCAMCGEDWWQTYEGDEPPDTTWHNDDQRISCPGIGYRVPMSYRR